MFIAAIVDSKELQLSVEVMVEWNMTMDELARMRKEKQELVERLAYAEYVKDALVAKVYKLKHGEDADSI